MGKIVTENGEKAQPKTVELPEGMEAYLLVVFNPKTGQFGVKMDGAMPPELLYFTLEELQNRIMQSHLQRRAQQAAAEQALRVQAAGGAGFPFGR